MKPDPLTLEDLEGGQAIASGIAHGKQEVAFFQPEFRSCVSVAKWIERVGPLSPRASSMNARRSARST